MKFVAGNNPKKRVEILAKIGLPAGGLISEIALPVFGVDLLRPLVFVKLNAIGGMEGGRV